MVSNYTTVSVIACNQKLYRCVEDPERAARCCTRNTLGTLPSPFGHAERLVDLRGSILQRGEDGLDVVLLPGLGGVRVDIPVRQKRVRRHRRGWARALEALMRDARDRLQHALRTKPAQRSLQHFKIQRRPQPGAKRTRSSGCNALSEPMTKGGNLTASVETRRRFSGLGLRIR